MTPKNILIIDDDAELCEELAEALSAAGHSVATAPDPARGGVLARARDFDSIILDYKLPRVTGPDILRNLGGAVRARLILISGRPRAELGLRQKGLDSLVSSVLEKPIDIELLLKLIQGPP